MSESAKSPLFSNAVYDKLKFLALVVLPALAVLYAALAGLLGLPAALQVSGAIMAIDAFLGAILGLSTKQYNEIVPKYDGAMNVIQTDTRKVFQLELNHDDPAPLQHKQEVRFEVKNKQMTDEQLDMEGIE